MTTKIKTANITDGAITGAKIALSINALNDVDTSTTATSGQSLIWNSTSSQWIPGNPAVSVTSSTLSVFSIDVLSDVNTTSAPPTAGQVLIWSTATSQWIPGTVVSAGGGGSATETISPFMLAGM